MTDGLGEWWKDIVYAAAEDWITAAQNLYWHHLEEAYISGYDVRWLERKVVYLETMTFTIRFNSVSLPVSPVLVVFEHCGGV